MKAEVRVYLIDVYAPDYGNNSLIRHQGRSQKITHINELGVSIRDAYACGLFNRIVANNLAGNRTGCVLLYGSIHLTGGMHVRAGISLADRLNLDYVVFE
jgi:hypothetical protein